MEEFFMQIKELLKNYEFKAMIHTFQITLPKEESLMLDLHRRSFMKELSSSAKDDTKIIFNLDNYPYKNSNNIQTLKNFKAAFKQVIAELNIKEYIIDRVDVAVNTEWEYESCYKLNCYLNNLDALRMQVKNSYFTNDFKFNKRTLKNKKSKYEFEIYNKELESKSNGKNEARTRLEYRSMKLPELTFETAIKNYINTLSKLPEYIDELNKQRINDLYKQYCYEIENHAVNSFTEFVCRYNELIYNTKTLNGLHDMCLKGQATSWASKFRNNHEIVLYKNQDIELYISVLKSALEKYLKS